MRSLRNKIGVLAVVWAASASAVALAHDLVPPKVRSEVEGLWPDGRKGAHDVLVPVVVTVDSDGRVVDARVEASVSPSFDAAALLAAKQWTFEPARRDGQPVPAKLREFVRFSGKPEVSASLSAPSPAVVPPTNPSPAPPASQPARPRAAAKSELDQVRVHGRSPPRSASEVVRDRELVNAAPHRTASDALTVVPGVFVTQHSGEGKAHQIFLRGFDAVHGQDIEIWAGGVPVNEVSNVHGQGYADLHFLPPEVIKEIHATPGAYDPKQGDFAVAGTLRLTLGYPEPGFTAKAGAGSFGARRLFLAAHPADMSDETFVAFEEYGTDGFGPNRSARRTSLVGQATHDFGDGLAARVLATTYAGRYDSAGVVRAVDIESGRVDAYATYDPKQGGSSTRSQVLVELHRDTDEGRWSVAPFFALRSLSLRQNFTGFFNDTQRSGARTLNSDNNQQLNEDLMVGVTGSYRRGLRIFSSRDAFEVGVYGRHDWIEQSQRRLSEVDSTPTETVIDARVRATNVAGYGDLALYPLPRLAVRGGIRVDALAFSAQDRTSAGDDVPQQQRNAQGAHFGKKLTLDYAVAPRLRIVGSYGEGFRSPQARSLSDGERTPFTEVRGVEVGVRYGEGTRLAGSLAAFSTGLSDDLVFDQETARNERVPSTRRDGLALELTSKVGWLTTSVSATYTRAVFTNSNERFGEGDLLPYVPQLVVRGDVAARPVLARIAGSNVLGQAGLGIQSLVRRPLPFSEIGRNVTLFDVSLGARWRFVEVDLDIYNALDALFYDGQFVYASNFERSPNPPLVPFQHVTVGPPRSFFGSVNLYF